MCWRAALQTMQPGGSLALAIDAGRFTVKSFTDYDAHDQARLALIQQAAHGSDLVVGDAYGALPRLHRRR